MKSSSGLEIRDSLTDHDNKDSLIFRDDDPDFEFIDESEDDNDLNFDHLLKKLPARKPSGSSLISASSVCDEDQDDPEACVDDPDSSSETVCSSPITPSHAAKARSKRERFSKSGCQGNTSAGVVSIKSPSKVSKNGCPKTPTKETRTSPQISPTKGWREADDILLIHLKGMQMTWSAISEYFPDKNTDAVRVHYNSKLAKLDPLEVASRSKTFGVSKGWTPEQDVRVGISGFLVLIVKRLLVMLKTKGMKWHDIKVFFPGKKQDAIRVHYNSKLAKTFR